MDVLRNDSDDGECSLDSLVRAVQSHASGRNPHDDVTLVGFGRLV